MLRTIHQKPLQRDLSIYYKLTIKAEPAKVFEALSIAAIIDEWGGGPARVQAKIDGEISLWDGEIYGNIREIEWPSRLVHTLRHKDWLAHKMESLVSWRLESVSRGTLVQMEHKDIPSRKLRDIQNELWAASFLGPLKAYLE